MTDEEDICPFCGCKGFADLAKHLRKGFKKITKIVWSATANTFRLTYNLNDYNLEISREPDHEMIAIIRRMNFQTIRILLDAILPAGDTLTTQILKNEIPETLNIEEPENVIRSFKFSMDCLVERGYLDHLRKITPEGRRLVQAILYQKRMGKRLLELGRPDASSDDIVQTGNFKRSAELVSLFLYEKNGIREWILHIPNNFQIGSTVIPTQTRSFDDPYEIEQVLDFLLNTIHRGFNEAPIPYIKCAIKGRASPRALIDRGHFQNTDFLISKPYITPALDAIISQDNENIPENIRKSRCKCREPVISTSKKFVCDCGASWIDEDAKKFCIRSSNGNCIRKIRRNGVLKRVKCRFYKEEKNRPRCRARMKIEVFREYQAGGFRVIKKSSGFFALGQKGIVGRPGAFFRPIVGKVIRQEEARARKYARFHAETFGPEGTPITKLPLVKKEE